MTTPFFVCFIAGLGLSVLSFASGLHVAHLPALFHGHRLLHLPRGARGPAHRGQTVNAAAMAAFLVWFGGSGLLLTRFVHWTTTVVSTLAAFIGLTAAVLINALLGALARQESRAEPISMIGMIGRTTVTIRAGGTGEIVFAHAGTRRVAAARSDDGAAIPRGVEVVVLRYEKGVAYVTTWDELSAQ